MGNLTASDRRILTAINTGASILSLLGSSFIVLCYLLFKDLRRFSFKLVFFLALSELNHYAKEKFDSEGEEEAKIGTEIILPYYDGSSQRIFFVMPRAIAHIFSGFKSVGYYPLTLIGSWAFGTINLIRDLIELGHKIFWLSVLNVGMTALMVTRKVQVVVTKECKVKRPTTRE